MCSGDQALSPPPVSKALQDLAGMTKQSRTVYRRRLEGNFASARLLLCRSNIKIKSLVITQCDFEPLL